jgi:hypothetical protein
MDEKALALRLADALTVQVEIGGGDLTELEQAAAELRRLHDLNGELLEALKRIDEMCAAPPNFSDATMQEIARAAIARAEGEQT